MSTIKAPKANLPPDQRPLACSVALEGDFNVTIDMLVKRAQEAGWSESEAEEACLSLAHNRRMAQLENETTDAAIDEAWESLDGETEH